MAVRDLKRIVERSDTPAGGWFDQIVLAAILVSLVAFSFDTLPALSSDVRQLLWLVEVVTVAIFTTEYALRLIVADSPRRFALSFFGIIDLIAILPFYLSLGVDLRSIRVLRVLRLLRIIRVGRYMQALDRLQRAGRMVREELVLFLGVSLALIYLSAVGVYYFEHDSQPEQFASVFHSLWWAVVTLTTVGYGDVYPVTLGGRLFTFVVLFLGLGIVAVPTGLIASSLSKVGEGETK